MTSTAVHPSPPFFVAPRGAQLLGLVCNALNAFIARRRAAKAARRARRIALDTQRHRAETAGDVAALPARLAGLNR